jgi:hypothetical protein
MARCGTSDGIVTSPQRGGMTVSAAQLWESESGKVHAVPPHQIPFLLRAGRFLGRPQLVQVPEVGVHSRTPGDGSTA